MTGTQKRKPRFLDKIDDAVFAALVAKIEAGTVQPGMWQIIARSLVIQSGSDQVRDCSKARGIGQADDDHSKLLAKKLEELKGHQVTALIVELLVCRGLRGLWGEADKQRKAMLQLYKIDEGENRRARARGGKNEKEKRPYPPPSHEERSEA